MLLQMIIKKKYSSQYYWLDPTIPLTDSGLENLIDFLFNNIKTDLQYRKYADLLEKCTTYSLSSDTNSFEIKNNGMVEVAHLILEDLPEFITTKPNMLKILNDWHSILNQQPPFIKITMDEHQNVSFIPLTEYEPVQ